MSEYKQPLDRTSVPFDILRESYPAWVPDFLIVEKTEKEIKRLREKRKEFIDLISTRESKSKQWLVSLENADGRQAQLLSKFLMQNARHADVFKRLEYVEDVKYNLRCTPELLEKAIALIPDDFFSDMASDEITKEIKSVEKLIQEKKERIREHSPESLFMFKDANVRCFAPHEFVRHWRNLQTWVKDPVNPQGYTLSISSPEERQAYYDLEINKSILPKAKRLAHPGPGSVGGVRMQGPGR
jgi:hypothetical protein